MIKQNAKLQHLVQEQEQHILLNEQIVQEKEQVIEACKDRQDILSIEFVKAKLDFEMGKKTKYYHI